MSDEQAEPLPLVHYPDPFLNKRTREITPEELKAGQADGWKLTELIERMFATMYAEEGVGLAAPQVGIGLRLWVADSTADGENAFYAINPLLQDLQGEVEAEEGCLSIPNVRSKVKRAQSLILNAVNLNGESIELNLQDFVARIAQHETDHLDGILFIQKIGTAARFMLRGKLRELEDEYEFRKRRKQKSR